MRRDDLVILLAVALKPTGSGVFIPTNAYGAELLTNGDFSAWTGGDPTGWTVVGESGSDPAISESAPGGGAGNGAAKWNMTATGTALQLRQTVYNTGDYYETAGSMTAYTSGRLDIVYGATGGTPLPALSSARAVRLLNRAADPELRMQTGGATPRVWTIDDFSVKKLTPSTQKTAASADMDVIALYTLPASPVAGDSFWLVGRISSFSSGNYWLVYLDYTGTQWNVTLYSVASHTRTSQKSATNVGTTNALRFYANGTTIRIYTSSNSGTNWTQRDTDLTSATYQTATDYNVLAGSQFTLGALSATVSV